jgi:hypothetical protein
MLARFPEALKRKKSPLSDYFRSRRPTTAYHACLWFTKVFLICYLLQHRGRFKQATAREFPTAFAFYQSHLVLALSMTSRPGREAFTNQEWKLIERLRTPAQVQHYLSALPYNWERDGGTMRSFREVVKRNEVHCLEAAVAAAVILEQHDYPPLLLDLESVDLLDHVIYVFQKDRLWGSIGRSRDIGLHGRKPVFRNLRQLVWSYFDPYIDMSGRIKGYGLTSLYDLGNYDWRFSARNMHKIEDHLRAISHRAIRSSDRRYEYWHERYKKYRKRYPDRSPSYYGNRNQWML